MADNLTLPPSVTHVVDLLAKVHDAREVEEQAAEARKKAELELAEFLMVSRRDKDMAFDAEFDAKQTIVDIALIARRAELAARSQRGSAP